MFPWPSGATGWDAADLKSATQEVNTVGSNPTSVTYGSMLELVYSLVLETRAERRVGSSPTTLTKDGYSK